MRRTAGYSLLDHMRNKHILYKMKVTSVTDYVNNYRQNWLQHVKRMDRARIPKQMFRYAPLDDDCQENRRKDGSLMMEAVRTSETSVDNNFTRQYNPEDNSEHGWRP
jgi:hypothetical protein